MGGEGRGRGRRVGGLVDWWIGKVEWERVDEMGVRTGG